jgi:hypothetical protein
MWLFIYSVIFTERGYGFSEISPTPLAAVLNGFLEKALEPKMALLNVVANGFFEDPWRV